MKYIENFKAVPEEVVNVVHDDTHHTQENNTEGGNNNV